MQSKQNYLLMANGQDYSGGAFESLIEYFDSKPYINYLAVRNPLLNWHEATSFTFANGSVFKKKRKFNLPPFTYLFDFFFTPKSKEPAICICFNSLATIFIWIKNRKKCRWLIIWSIDFVPERFKLKPLNFIYKKIEKFAHHLADEHWEVSTAALEGRQRIVGTSKAIHKVVPIGIDLKSINKVEKDNFTKKIVVYFGSIDKRNGSEKLPLIIKHTLSLDSSIKFKIMGGGPELDSLRKLIISYNLGHNVEITGFIKDFDDAYRVLSASSIAIAPYDPGPDHFTYYADPGKFKAYLAAGLPIITNRVPPNSFEIEKFAGATVLDNDADAELYAKKILQILSNFDDWSSRSDMASKYIAQFDWRNIIVKNLPV